MPEPRSRWLLVAVLGLAALAAALDLAYRPPSPLARDAPASEFSAHRAKAELDALLGEGRPHPIGSAAGAAIRSRIEARLESLGYVVRTERGWVCQAAICGTPVNLVATLPRKSDVGGPAEGDVVLAAHYDSVPAGPGAADDGASVAALIEIARILALRPPGAHRPILLIDDGEEAGLLGAALYVRDPETSRTRAAVNLEARGTSGPSLMFETGTANRWLMQLYRHAIARPMTNSLYYTVYKLLPNDTDFSVFKQAGYQGFNFAFIGDVGHYHTPRDDAAHLALDSLQHQGANALAAFTALLEAKTLPDAATESVFFDIGARTLAAWPASLALPAALCVFGLLLVECLAAMRGGSARALAWSVGGIVGMPLVATLITATGVAALMEVGSIPRLGSGSWVAHPYFMEAASIAIACAAVGACSYLLAGRATPASALTAAVLAGGALAVATAALTPGASFPFLIASAMAALCLLPVLPAAAGRRSMPAWVIPSAALAAALSLFAACGALLIFLYDAVGAPAWPLTTLVLSLVGGYLMAPWLLAGRRATRRLLAASTAAAVLGLVGAAASPVYSVDWPERVDLEYWYDADSRQAHYFASCDSHRLPAAWAVAAAFDPRPRARFPGSPQRGFVAPAPVASLEPPETILERADGGVDETATNPEADGLVKQSALRAVPPPRDNARYALTLRSRRGAPGMDIVFPASGRVASAAIETADGSIGLQPLALHGGAALVRFAGLPPEGVRLRFEWSGPRPASVQVIEWSYGLAVGGPIAARRPSNTIASQIGDATVVRRTVSLR